jgi:hypothetical protein
MQTVSSFRMKTLDASVSGVSNGREGHYAKLAR